MELVHQRVKEGLILQSAVSMQSYLYKQCSSSLDNAERKMIRDQLQNPWNTVNSQIEHHYLIYKFIENT